jgi:hypothetical protein
VLTAELDRDVEGLLIGQEPVLRGKRLAPEPHPGRTRAAGPSYTTYLLLHNIPCLLATDDCEIVITTESVSPAVKAARDLLRAIGIEPGMGEP